MRREGRKEGREEGKQAGREAGRESRLLLQQHNDAAERE